MLTGHDALSEPPSDLGYLAFAKEKRPLVPGSKTGADALHSNDKMTIAEPTQRKQCEEEQKTNGSVPENQADRQPSSQDTLHKQQKDFVLLTMRSAVKNNPLKKKLEQPLQPSLQDSDNSNRQTRESNVISSLKDKSYVSTSVFRQGDSVFGRDSPPPRLSPTSAALLPCTELSAPFENAAETENPIESFADSGNAIKSLEITFEKTTTASTTPPAPASALDATQSHTSRIERTTETESAFPRATQHDLQAKTDMVTDLVDEQQLFVVAEIDPWVRKESKGETQRYAIADGVGLRRCRGSQRSHWSAGIRKTSCESPLDQGSHKSIHSESDSEQWFDSNDDWRGSIEGGQSIMNQTRQLAATSHASNCSQTSVTNTVEDTSGVQPASPLSFSRPISHEDTDDLESVAVFSADERLSEAVQTSDNDSMTTTDDDTIRGVSLHSEQEQTRDQSLSSDTSVASSAFQSTFSRRRTADSIDSWAPPSPPTCHSSPFLPKANLDQETAEAKDGMQTDSKAYGHAAVETTSMYTSYHLPEKMDNDSLLAPTTINLDLPLLQNMPENAPMRAYGKLFLRVCVADHLLLPLPRQTTYVRCVVSDGHYEFMSRYELLAPTTVFEYECIMDTFPGMVITASLHVRPDAHVRPKTGLTRLLTPARKQREVLSGYVHPQDGAIGQSRFSLDHMIHRCYEKTFASQYDCFNSWYARSSRERQQQKEVLKVVGHFKIETLYLPVTDPSLPVPSSLRACDLALRIRQWHNTCWQSGYLAIRLQNTKIWKRQYCTLIGSRFICYTSKEASSGKPTSQYDIADTIRLSAAADQVVVSLVDRPDNRIFQEQPICPDTGRGFFRITFPDKYIDCVGDHVQESEDWVRILKSMVGRVPLKVSFSA